MCILVTGCAGFIGFHFVQRLLAEEADNLILGIDDLNDYYDVRLKEYRLSMIAQMVETLNNKRWKFIRGDISDKLFIEGVFEKYHPAVVVNLAAQAGVRYSITNPDEYIRSNIIGFYNIIQCCRNEEESGRNFRHLVFASSSSVYGNVHDVPFKTSAKSDEPVSLYATTKKTDELIAYTYSRLYGIPSTGLRFFTVYGPAGRPDMAYYLFADAFRKGEKVKIFNHGKCERDFTYVDDIITGLVSVMSSSPVMKWSQENKVPFKVYNLGNGHPQNLLQFVNTLRDALVDVGVIEKSFDIAEHIVMMDAQPGEVDVTYADMTEFENDFGYRPYTDIRTGLIKFASWYAEFCGAYKL